MGLCFSSTPQLFGSLHIISLFLICLFNIIFYHVLKNKDEHELLVILHRLGAAMCIAEIFKQVFCFIYVFDRKLNLWFFPWQLCSMAMYVSFITIYLEEKKQNAMLVFLATFSLLSDIVALLLPYDMLRDQVLLFIHSFAYHGLIITESMIALLILRNRKDIRFFPSVIVFLIMAFIAEIINVTSHAVLNDIYREPNMFYITLSYPTTQIVFHDIAVRFSIPVEIILYLSFIILSSCILYLIEMKILKKEVHI